MRYTQRSAPPPDGARKLSFVMSDGSVDRMGDVIEPAGWDLRHFKKHPIALFNHDKDQIIGKWENVRVNGDKLVGDLALADAGTSPLVDTIRALVEQDILRAVSVGFKPKEKEPLDEDASEFFGPFRFKKQELLEASLVAVPANPNALQVARAFGLSPDQLAAVFGKPAHGNGERVAKAIIGKPAKVLAPEGARMSTLSQRIETKQKRITELRDKLVELEGKDEQTPEERELSDEIPDLLEAEEKELASLIRKEKALAPRTTAVAAKSEFAAAPLTGEIMTPAEVTQRTFAMPKKKIEHADFVVRAMRVGLRAFATQTSLDQALRASYPGDEGTEIILRAAVNPAATTVSGYALELVQTAYGAFMDRLLAGSLYGPLAASGARFDLGSNGTLQIPTRTTTSKASGAWVGEGGAKPVKKISLAPVTLTPHKLAVITTFTEEMALYSNPAIEGILRKSMDDDTREALDGFLIDNVASSASRPAGLLQGVVAITAASTGTTIEKIVADINGLIAPMEAAGGGGRVVLMMNPKQARRLGMAQTTTGDFAFADQAEAASKFGITRILVSTSVPADTVIAVDAEWFATVTGDTPRFAVSNEATLHEEDTTPLALSATGSPNVVAAPMRSLFQTDSIALRLSLYVTWKMTRSNMVQFVAGVGW